MCRDRPRVYPGGLSCQTVLCIASVVTRLSPLLHCGRYTGGGINSELRATVWVNPAGKVRKAGDPEPTYVVRTMEELPGIVDQLMAADAA